MSVGKWPVWVHVCVCMCERVPVSAPALARPARQGSSLIRNEASEIVIAFQYERSFFNQLILLSGNFSRSIKLGLASITFHIIF